MKEINDADVEKIIKSDKLVIIDLFGTWCGPCKQLAPKLEEVEKENSANTEIVKMDIDINPITPAKHHVRGVPTLLFYKNGALVDRMVGNQSKENIQALIDKHTKTSGDGLFGDDF